MKNTVNISRDFSRGGGANNVCRQAGTFGTQPIGAAARHYHAARAGHRSREGSRARQSSFPASPSFTTEFDKAGEAYFLARHEMDHLPGQSALDAALPDVCCAAEWDGGSHRRSGNADANQARSRREITCGFLLPDGKSLIFASTAGKEDPNVKEAVPTGKAAITGWRSPPAWRFTKLITGSRKWNRPRQRASIG